jgi:UDP-GlcNAc3NAcA epimerase
MKVCTVVGARPQFIKASAVSRVLKDQADVREVLIHTGQHYDDNLSNAFFEQLDIPRPDYNLSVGSAPHGAQTGRMLEMIETLFLDERPDRVLLYGDTNSTLAGALAATKLNVRIAHVEAGLRSFNSRMPEEVNRVLADHASRLKAVLPGSPRWPWNCRWFCLFIRPPAPPGSGTIRKSRKRE